MFNEEPLPLNEEGCNFVELLLRNNLAGKDNFNYSVYINRKEVALVDRSTDINDFLNLISWSAECRKKSVLFQ